MRPSCKYFFLLSPLSWNEKKAKWHLIHYYSSRRPSRWSLSSRTDLTYSKKKTYPNFRFILLVGLFFVFDAWMDAASNPLESFSISAPNCPNADMVQGVGSGSWIHNSCVSIVVNSVSVEAAEWAAWTGVVCFVRVAVSNFLQVHLLSKRKWRGICWNYLIKCQ